MDLRTKIADEFKVVLDKLGYDKEIVVSFSNLPKICDFQTSYAMMQAKKVGKKPFELAEEIVEHLKSDVFQYSVAMPGFINIKVSDSALSKIANEIYGDKMLGVDKVEKPRKLLIDYGGANVAKELHVGHLRSPIIGEALKRLHKFMGDTVFADTHLGDWGMQMGLTILQLKIDGYLDDFFVAGALE